MLHSTEKSDLLNLYTTIQKTYIIILNQMTNYLIFYTIDSSHIAIGHGSQDRTFFEWKTKYYNITVEIIIMIYLRIGIHWKKKPSNSKLGQFLTNIIIYATLYVKVHGCNLPCENKWYPYTTSVIVIKLSLNLNNIHPYFDMVFKYAPYHDLQPC